MSTRFNLKMEIDKSDFIRSIKVRSDKQLYDTYDKKEDATDHNYEMSFTSLSEFYKSLYDVTQTNDSIPPDAEFYVDNELFAKMVDGFHLEMNEELSESIVSKYGSSLAVDFVTSSKISEAYSEERELEGLSLYRNDDIRAYRGSESGNYIKDKNSEVEFKDEAEVALALNYYLKEDRNAINLHKLDSLDVTLNGKKFISLKMGKEVKQEIPKATRRNRLRS